VRHRLFDVRPGEWRRAALLFAFWFLVIAVFWVLKPVRTARFVHVAGVQSLPLVKLTVALIVLPVVLLYSYASAHVRRGPLIYVCSGIFAGLCLLFRSVDPTHAGGAYALFFFVDIYNTVMVALFWSYLNDTSTPDEAKRLYGVIGTGGILGGATGASLTGFAVRSLGVGNLLFVCVALLAGIVVLAAVLERDRPGGIARSSDQAPGLRVALEGARLIARSRYLRGIVAVVALYEIISVLVDYQFNAAVAEHFASDETGFTSFTAKLNAALIAASAVFQFFATSWVQRRLGLLVALSILPAALLGGSALFLVLPTLATATIMFVGDGTFAYSVHQSSREMLYTPETREAKYRAKAFIDMFAMRLAKGVSAGMIALCNALAVAPRFLSLLSAAVLALWWLAIRRTAREFEARIAR